MTTALANSPTDHQKQKLGALVIPGSPNPNNKPESTLTTSPEKPYQNTGVSNSQILRT